MESKTCTKCLINKPLDDFHLDKAGPGGRTYYCRDCTNAYRRARRAANPEKIRAADKKSRSKHYGTKEWQQRCRTFNQKYYYADVEKSRAYWKKWREQNKDFVSDSNKRQRAKRKQAEVFVVLQKELDKIYSSSCVFCGSTENITLDHIVPLVKGGRHSVGNLQPLCLSCNSSKNSDFWFEWLVKKSTALVR